MGKYPFSFRVCGYRQEDNTYYEQCGMGICKSYQDAVTILEKRYGNELNSIKHIELYEDDTVICMPYEIMTKLVHEYHYGTKIYETQISENDARIL